MGPKKAAGNKAAGEAVEGEDPLVLLQNYQKFCKYMFLRILLYGIKRLQIDWYSGTWEVSAIV